MHVFYKVRRGRGCFPTSSLSPPQYIYSPRTL
nr:MAG TPA: hypothetical protein [Caudoviricetes sp.]